MICPPAYSTYQRLNENEQKDFHSMFTQIWAGPKRNKVQSLTSAYVFGKGILMGDWNCCWWYLGYPDIRESCYRCIREGGLLCFPINPQHNSIDRHLYYAASHYQGHQTASRFFGYDFEPFYKVSSIEYRDIEYGYRTVLIQGGTVASTSKSLGPEILLGFSSLASIVWVTSEKMY